MEKKSLKIALLGYGKMGKAVEAEATMRGHQIVAKIDQDNYEEIHQLSALNPDCAIEFTHPDSFERNLDQLLESEIPMVSGTTGWYDRLDSIRHKVLEKNGSLLYASNFSVGVQVLFKLNQKLAEMMNPHSQYDPFIEEQHHRYKADGPSGTAHTLARDLISRLDRKEEVSNEDLRHRPPKAEELSIGFVRSGEIVGRHQVSYTSDIDTISISHHAHNRRGFALGSVIAAEWLVGKQGFFEFGDLF